MDPEFFLKSLFKVVVDSAKPEKILTKYLPKERTCSVVVVGAGKAAAAMAKALEMAWEGPVKGLVVVPYGHKVSCKHIEVLEASHPVPDHKGQLAAKAIMERVSGLSSDDLVVCLISGGGSSLLPFPPSGISLYEKQQVNKKLLKSGATISEINCVRKHLSLIKGGRLGAAAWPAQLITYAISDVPGDDPAIIASGPTVSDSSTSDQAMEILDRYNINHTETIKNWLGQPDSESIKPGDSRLENNRYYLVATPHSSLKSAAAMAHKEDVNSIVLSDEMEGEAKDIALAHGAIARFIKSKCNRTRLPCVILSGGETTVSVRGDGKGGRNSEFLLALANNLKGEPGIYALACDTDGIDGSEDNAGAIYSPNLWLKAMKSGLNSREYLDNNNAYEYFNKLGALVRTGPTMTNVNDFRAVLVLPD